MIECEQCGAESLHGALYCTECGASLLPETVDVNGTDLPFSDVLAPISEPALLGQQIGQERDAKTLVVFIPTSGRQLEIPLNNEIRIGRVDPEGDYYPELDLTPDKAADYGVSRSHALIRKTGEGVVLLDSSSTNGTMLNGYLLPAELPYPLRSGDEVRFGQLLVHVFLE
jgi:pSer/pThr/pTyr-binding forkhead associated (FHA) protein